MSAVADLADRYGFLPASRPGVDESRWSRSSATHEAFVSAGHLLCRGVLDAHELSVFQADLSTAREWLEEGGDGRILRVGQIEMRPLASFELEVQAGDELVSLSRPEAQALHSPDDWPVLEEEPDGT